MQINCYLLLGNRRSLQQKLLGKQVYSRDTNQGRDSTRREKHLGVLLQNNGSSGNRQKLPQE